MTKRLFAPFFAQSRTASRYRAESRPVIARKVSHCTRNARGSGAFEAWTSVLATLSRTLSGPDLLDALPASDVIVNFDGVGGNGPANPSDPCQRNDDDVTLVRNLGFNFDLFGTAYNQVFINNNGNVSFGNSFTSQTAFTDTYQFVVGGTGVTGTESDTSWSFASRDVVVKSIDVKIT